MKKVFYLKTCDTCLKILKQFDLNGWEKREIKTQPITEEEIEEMYKISQSYEALFNKKSTQIKLQELDLKSMQEADFKELLMNHYTFLKRPVFVTDKEKAENLFNTIEKLPNTERLDEFKKQVIINSQDFISNKKDGNIGWIEIQKLDKNIQEKIKDKNTNDILIAPLENIGWQILLVADYKPAKEVSFEESKEFLTKLAKQQELMKKVDSLLK